MKKKVYLVAIIVILIGIILVAVKGFNVNLRYRAHKAVYLPIDSEFQIKDIEKICKEVFGKEEFQIEKAGIYNDSAMVSAKEINDEQIKKLKDKVNEKFNPTQDLTITIGENYETEDIKNIVTEVLGKEPKDVYKSEDDEKNVVIQVDVLTETDLEDINNKINEKYNLTNNASASNASLVITKNSIPRVRLLDMAKQYILYVAIATICVLIYFTIRFKNLGISFVLKESIGTIVVAECFYMAVLALVRYPIDKISMVGALTVYLASITIVNNSLMQNVNEAKKQKKKEKN